MISQQEMTKYGHQEERHNVALKILYMEQIICPIETINQLSFVIF